MWFCIHFYKFAQNKSELPAFILDSFVAKISMYLEICIRYIRCKVHFLVLVFTDMVLRK